MSIEQARKMLAMPTTRLFTAKDAFLMASVVPPEAEITDLGVHPRTRRTGQARRLIAELQDITDTIFLDVAETNTTAISLYQSSGFRVTGRRPHYYEVAGGYVDGLLMTWTSAAAAHANSQESVDPPTG